MSHEHQHHDHGHQHSQGKRPLHQDWRMWAVVLLMLGAIGIYIATMDEAVAPGVKPATVVPAAPAAAE